jgi:hypothetical protein
VRVERLPGSRFTRQFGPYNVLADRLNGADESIMPSFSSHLKDWIEERGPLFLLRPYMKWRYRRRTDRGSGDLERTFTEIYRGNEWGDEKSLSGPGSNSESEYTRIILAELPALVRKLNCRLLLDAPCGDFAWMRHVDLGGCKYVGGDIVTDVIRVNQERFGGPSRAFVQLDIIKDDFPRNVDLMLVRDCFIHLSLDGIRLALANIRRNGVKYLLASTYRNKRRNWDIESGGFRPVNLQKPPFDLPEPELFIQEDFLPERPAFERSLGLWRVDSLNV